MREIKFRAWDKMRGKMIGRSYPDNWANYKDEWYDDEAFMCLTSIEDIAKDNDYVVMQYTNLKDTNKKEIYEGDIVQWSTTDWVTKETKVVTQGVVKFGPYKITSMPHDYEGTNEDAYGYYVQSKLTEKDIKHGESGQATLWEGFEVIGNVWENPELLNN